MSRGGIVDLAVGLAFVLGFAAGISCALTEITTRFLGMRGACLLRGIYQLVDGDDGTSTDLARAQEDYAVLRTALRHEPARQTGAGPPLAAGARAPASPSTTGALLGSPILRSQGMTGQISGRRLTLKPARQEGRLAVLQASSARARWRESRSLPSYIPARSFAVAVIDLLVPDPARPVAMSTIRRSIDALPASMSKFRRSLGTLAKSAGGDVGRFRDLVERWYDDQMERVSGRYGRRVSAITLVIAVLLVLSFNINVVTLGRALYGDAIVQAAVSTAAANGTSCGRPGTAGLPGRPGRTPVVHRGGGLADRVGDHPWLRSGECAMQLARQAGDPQQSRRFGLAAHTHPDRLPGDNRGLDPRCAVVVQDPD